MSADVTVPVSGRVTVTEVEQIDALCAADMMRPTRSGMVGKLVRIGLDVMRSGGRASVESVKAAKRARGK